MNPTKRAVVASEAWRWALEHWGLRTPQPDTWRSEPTSRTMRASASPGPIITTAHASSSSRIQAMHRPGGVPVVIRGAARSWKATNAWSLDWLAEHHGDHVVPTDDRTANGDVVSVSLREAVERTRGGQSGYTRFSPLLIECPELVDDLDLSYLLDVTGTRARGVLFQLFSGGAGTRTETHCAVGNNAFVQIHGEKIWRFVAPHHSAALRPLPLGRPYFASAATLHDPSQATHADAPIHEIRLQAGDVLLVPPFWWHQVDNPTESIGVAMRWHHPMHALKQSAFLTTMTLTARNPNLVKANKQRRGFGMVYQHAVDQSRELLESGR